jgi:hypothetical protein
MIAYPLPSDDSSAPLRRPAAGDAPAGGSRGGGTRSGRTAAAMRRGRTSRIRYRALFVFVGVLLGLGLITTPYLALVSNAARLNYQLYDLHLKRSNLIDRTAVLDYKIARLESRERLAGLARALGMHEPKRYPVAVVPPPQAERPHGLALLSIPKGWLR